MLMHDYEGLGGRSLVMTDANEFFFTNLRFFNCWFKMS